jgi:hypothetical protein
LYCLAFHAGYLARVPPRASNKTANRTGIDNSKELTHSAGRTLFLEPRSSADLFASAWTGKRPRERIERLKIMRVTAVRGVGQRPPSGGLLSSGALFEGRQNCLRATYFALEVPTIRVRAAVVPLNLYQPHGDAACRAQGVLRLLLGLDRRCYGHAIPQPRSK